MSNSEITEHITHPPTNESESEQESQSGSQPENVDDIDMSEYEDEDEDNFEPTMEAILVRHWQPLKVIPYVALS